MAYGSQASRSALGLILFSAMALSAAAQTVAVRHEHLRPRTFGSGSLTVSDTGLSYAETGKKAEKHKWTLPWQDIEQLWVSPTEMRVVTYADVWWKLGADREYELKTAPGASFQPLYADLKGKLGPKLTAAFGADAGNVLWEVPVKLRKKFGGSEGTLEVGSAGVVYRSKEKSESRTWVLADIDNIGSSGPYDLTITTFERSKLDYGDRKSFNFQLKQPLDERRYNALWRRLNESKHLDYISSIKGNNEK